MIAQEHKHRKTENVYNIQWTMRIVNIKWKKYDSLD